MTIATPARLLALPASLALLALAPMGAASAHVTVTPSSTEAGTSSLLTFSNGHGCEGSPTTAITIQIPEQITSVTPTLNPNWEASKEMVELDEPITDSHGNEVTERVGTVTYTAKTPQPDGFRDTFVLSVGLPDAEGETLAFPVLQACEEGEHNWIEVPAAGQDPHDLASPAPTLTLTAASEDGGHGHGHDAEEPESTADGDVAADDAEEPTETGTEAAAQDGGSDGLAIAGLVAGLLGLVAGGAALAQGRRQK